MSIYNIYITLNTDATPTDLELGDLMNGISQTLDYPTVESPDGEWVRADYNIEDYSIEMYEESGERVWKYTVNNTTDDNDLSFNDYFMDMEHINELSKPKEFPHSDSGVPLGWLGKLFRRKQQ